MGVIGGIGVPELVIILLVVLILFGPKNLPKLGESLGKTVSGIRKGMEDDSAQSKKTEHVQNAQKEQADEDDSDVEAEPEALEAAPSAQAAVGSPAKKRGVTPKAHADEVQQPVSTAA